MLNYDCCFKDKRKISNENLIYKKPKTKKETL